MWCPRNASSNSIVGFVRLADSEGVVEAIYNLKPYDPGVTSEVVGA